IVDFIDATPKCSRRKLIEAFAPGSSAKPVAQTAPSEAGSAPPAAPLPEQPTPEMSALVSDLHWLIHEGHVIEFANGIMETAKRPSPRPPKPAPQAPPAENAGAQVTPAEGALKENQPAPTAPPIAEAGTDPIESAPQPVQPGDV